MIPIDKEGIFKVSRSLVLSEQKCVFSFHKGAEFGVFLGLCSTYVAFVFEGRFGSA